MLLTSFLFQIAELALLTPLVTFGIRALVSLSGSPVISDQEILAFALRPAGVLTLVVGISARVAVLALGQACLLGIALGAARGTPVAALSALGWSGARVVKILAVTTRLAIRILAVCAPFLAVAGLVYFFLLTEFDINYYLKDRPSELWIAAAIIGTLFVVMFALLAWKASSWVYTLPLLLFENVEPSTALGISEERSRGHRGVVALVFLGWILGVAALSILGVSATGELATALLPRVQGSLSLLVPSLGAILVLWVIESALLTAFVSIVFAALVIASYEKLRFRLSLWNSPRRRRRTPRVSPAGQTSPYRHDRRGGPVRDRRMAVARGRPRRSSCRGHRSSRRRRPRAGEHPIRRRARHCGRR